MGMACFTRLSISSFWFVIMAGIIWVLGLVFLGCLSGVVGHVYRCALYVYATEGVVPRILQPANAGHGLGGQKKFGETLKAFENTVGTGAVGTGVVFKQFTFTA